MKQQITKSYLQHLGVTNVTTDGRVFTVRGERKPQADIKSGRLTIHLHDQKKYKSTPKEKRTVNSGHVEIKLHHIVYAWFYSEVPYGKEIHHIDGNYLNNSLNNLEALTPEEHRVKHGRTATRELKCRLDIPREWYQKQLDELMAIENKTKVNYDKISNYRAKLRYYDSHIQEANKVTEFQKSKVELAYWKKCFKTEGNKKMWHECVKVENKAKESSIEDAQLIISHALEVIHRHFRRA